MTSTLVWVLALCDLCHGFSTTGVSTRRIALRHATIATRPSSPHQLLLRTPMMMMMMAEEGDATVADDAATAIDDATAAIEDSTVANEPAAVAVESSATVVADEPSAVAPTPSSVPDLAPPSSSDDVDWEKLARNLNPTKISKIVTNPTTWKNGLYGGSLAFAVLLPLGMILAASK